MTKRSTGHLTVISALIFSACASAGRQAAWEQSAATPAGTASDDSALVAEGDAQWANRDDKNAVLAAIEAWEKAATTNPSNANTLVKLSRAYYFLVDGHLALEAPANLDELKLSNHQKGVDWGEQALLVLDPSFESKMREGVDFEVAIKGIGATSVAAAYWYCTNLGRFAVAKGLSAKIFYKDRVKAAMERIRELDQNFFYAGADRYFGAFYSALPSIAGKDLDKSKEHFKIAIDLSPEYLPNKVVQADFLARELDDRAMYEALLNEVLSGAETDNPDIAPENRAAKRAAEQKLKQAADIF